MMGRREAPVSPQHPHLSVMLDQVLEVLAPKAGETYIDATFGAGGYSEAFLRSADCSVIAIDRDPDVMPHVQRLQQVYGERFQFIAGAFGDLVDLLHAANIDALDGVVLDLGVSSMQLDQGDRGFSIRNNGPLDMRMSRNGLSAFNVINEFAVDNLSRILAVYGDERRARAIAKAIERARQKGAIETTAQLVDIVTTVLGPHRGKGAHPATRTFQAIRIFVNDEVGELVRGLEAAEQLLAPEGRLVVVSFHSLEDRIVKKFLAERAGQTGRGSRYMPEAPSRPASFHGARSVAPNKSEVAINPRARSARLRVAKRTAESAWPAEVLPASLVAIQEMVQ